MGKLKYSSDRFGGSAAGQPFNREMLNAKQSDLCGIRDSMSMEGHCQAVS